MAIADQVFGFFMPVVNLMGPGSVKEVGVQAKSLGLKKALIVTDAFEIADMAAVSGHQANPFGTVMGRIRHLTRRLNRIYFL